MAGTVGLIASTVFLSKSLGKYDDITPQQFTPPISDREVKKSLIMHGWRFYKSRHMEVSDESLGGNFFRAKGGVVIYGGTIFRQGVTGRCANYKFDIINLL
jgi:hypothetical protein